MLTLLALLLWGAAARADYNPPDPPEPGVNFTLTTSRVPSDGGTLNVGSSQVYAFGTSVRLVAYPATGFVFTGWKDADGNILSTATDYTLVMPAHDTHVTATFRYNPGSPAEPDVPVIKHLSTVTLSASPSAGGSVSGGGTYEVGQNVSLRASTNSGFQFVNWTDETGEVISTSTNFTYTVPSGDPHLTANFRYNPGSPAEPGVPHISRNLTLLSNMEGSGSLSGGGWHDEGTSFTVSTGVNTYFTFLNWTDEEGNVVSESRSFTYTMPDRNVTLTANFSYFYNPGNPGEPGVPDIDDSVAPNTVYRPRFAMEGIDHVVIMCETDGVEMFYTLDGSTPDRNSTPYTGPVFVGSNLVVKAVAYKEGMHDSPVGTYQVRSYRAAEPTFSFEGFKVVIRSATPDAVIRYTLDYTEPNEESPVYTGPFVPEEDCRVKAYASKEGLTDSDVAKYAYRKYDYTVKAPEFSRTAEKVVEISCATPGAEIYYTLDGSDPTAASTRYSAPITLTGNRTIRAIAFRENFFDSPVSQIVIDDLGVPTPVAQFKGGLIVLTCEDADAAIRYTVDGSDPAESGTAADYTAPFLPETDCTVRFVALREGYRNSDTAEYVYVKAEHQVATPTIAEEDGRIVMTCATEGAVIRYTTDGADPTSASAPYESSITLTGNMTFKAMAFKEDMIPSEVATLTVGRFEVATPSVEFKDCKIVLTGADAADKIRYTLDGTAPGATIGTEYTGPFLPETDCTVKYIAYRDGYRDSAPGEYVYTKAEHQVATPALALDGEGRVTMTCPTEGAAIRYTTDGTDPTEASTLYEAPIVLTGNMSFKAKAFKENMFVSRVNTLTVDHFTVPKPEASYAAHHVTLTCSDPAAAIYYTTDGTEPLAQGTLYEAPVEVNDDTDFLFASRREGHHDSAPGSYSFRIADYRLAKPVFIPEYMEDRLTVKADTVSPLKADSLSIVVRGEDRGRFAPVHEFEPSREFGYDALIEARAITANPDLYDSEPETFLAEFYDEPQMGHNGHDFGIESETGLVDVYAGYPWGYQGIISTEKLCGPAPCLVRIDARTVGEEKFPSMLIPFGNSFFFDYDACFYPVPTIAGSGRDLERACELIGNGTTVMTELCASIDTADDLRYLAGRFTGLRALDLRGINLKAIPDSVLAPMSHLNTLYLPGSLTESSALLAGLPELTTLRWTNSERALPEGILDYAENPNMLVWTDGGEIGRDHNVVEIVTEHYPTRTVYSADRIVITDGYPFSVGTPVAQPDRWGLDWLTAASVEYEREFSQTTPAPGEGNGCGWETIALPFDVQSIEHESKGALVSFAARDNGAEGKPFWLYRADYFDTWTPAQRIDACIPYIIAMPEHEYYADEFRLGGKVRFSAKDVTISAYDCHGKSESRPGRIEFRGLIGPYDMDEYVPDLSMGLNSGMDDCIDENGQPFAPGAAFVRGVETLPMRAYMAGDGNQAYLPVFGDTSTVGGIYAEDTLTVEPLAGALRLTSGCDRSVAVYTTTGLRLMTVQLRAGEPALSDPLVPGIYIVAGRKVRVD